MALMASPTEATTTAVIKVLIGMLIAGRRTSGRQPRIDQGLMHFKGLAVLIRVAVRPFSVMGRSTCCHTTWTISFTYGWPIGFTAKRVPAYQIECLQLIGKVCGP